MGVFDRARRVARFARDVAMSQPEVRRRVENARAVLDEARTEVEARLREVESDLWAKIHEVEAEMRKQQRQVERRRTSAELYAVLGLQDGATLDEVKQAYRRKMRDHHPDRHANDPAAEARAHEAAQHINHAYAELVALLTGRESRRHA